MIVKVDAANPVHSAQVDDDARTDGSIGHARSRSAGNEGERSLLCPFYDRHYVISVFRNSDSCWNDSANPGSFGINSEGERIGPICPAKTRGRQVTVRQSYRPRVFTVGGF
jgi:hypothetical protein